MILVISNIANEAAATLVDMFPPGAASLITASGFHQSFKCGINVSNFLSSAVTVNGTAITAGDISGVITTIPHFLPQEFYYIEPADRDYVCSEMNAFFTYFLSELNCKKLNPPSIRSFSGFSMYKTEWIKIALAQQVPVLPVKLVNGAHAPGREDNIIARYVYTIIDGAIPGLQPPKKINIYMQALQKAFAMPYLQCYFAGTTDNEFFLADMVTVPDISNPITREAIADYFTQNSLYDFIMGPGGRYTHEHGMLRT